MMTSRIVRVRVKSRAEASFLEDAGDGSFVAHVKAAPVDGKANAELIALVARHFGCSKAAVSIKSGAGARTKLLHIDTSGRARD
jgi:uncharacterized protein YggU (UPF0235/DUF167 family)